MIKNKFIKRGRGILFALILIPIFINFISAAEPLTVNFYDEWYSTGFSSPELWMIYVETFANFVMNFTIVENNGTVTLVLLDSYGNPLITTNWVNLNENGSLEIIMNVTLPNGKSELNFEILLNNQSNILKYVNPEDYYNKSLGELLDDLADAGVNISFSENTWNALIVPKENENGTYFEVYYKAKPNQNFNSPIISNNTNGSTNNSTNNNQSYNNINDFLDESDNQNTVNGTNNENNASNLEILNPFPKENKVVMFVEDNKRFSIENEDYDSIKWYINSKVQDKKLSYFEYIALKEGNFTIKLELSKGRIVKTKTWQVEVLKKEENKSFLFTIIIFVIILLVIVLFIYKKLKSPTQTNNTLASNKISINKI
ncbi:hypothetical protein J4218_02490 [Candidatus Pacearchaeota archaeon]|nr:hypothetical protein [Candidatus Pacearchaeota archaeon]